MTQAEIKALIDEKITSNGAQEITGEVLNDVLQEIADACGYTFDIDVYPADAALEITFYNPGNPDGVAMKVNAEVSNLGNSKLEAISAWWAAQTERKLNKTAGYDIDLTNVSTSPSTLGVTKVIEAGQIIQSFTGASKLIFGATDATNVTVNSTDLPYTATKTLYNVKLESGTAANLKITVANGIVSVSQNSETGHTDIKVGTHTTPLPSVAEVEALKEEISDLSLGKFYGFFEDDSDLPTGDLDGYAYVGASMPFAIYVFKDGEWSDSGTTYAPPVGNGEDIDTNSSNQLQFADRAYDAQNPDGMGYVILRKDKTFAEQVANKDNTIFEIRYDFDLDNNEITLPQDCTLLFNGGKLSNGTLIGQNSKVNADLVQIFADINIDGTFNVISSYPVWFGAVGNGINDDTNAVQNAVIIGKGKCIQFDSSKTYKINESILIEDNTILNGNDCKILKNAYGSTFLNSKRQETTDLNKNIVIKNFTFESNVRGLCISMLGVDGLLIEGIKTNISIPLDSNNTPCWVMTISGDNIVVKDCNIVNLSGLFSDGIHFYAATNVLIDNVNVHVEDDCISFVAELSDEQRLWPKYNRITKNVKILNSQLESPTNVIRLQNRNNSPVNSAYQNVIIKNIQAAYSTANGSFLTLEDLREAPSTQSENIIIDTIQIKGNNQVPTKLRNGFNIFGTNPESIGNSLNFKNVSLSNVYIDSAYYSNLIRSINIDGLIIENCFFEGQGVQSHNKDKNLIIRNNIFGTTSIYTMLQLVNIDGCEITNNVIRNINAERAGIMFQLDKTINQLKIIDNIFKNFVYGLYTGNASELIISNDYIFNNVFHQITSKIRNEVYQKLTLVNYGPTSQRPAFSNINNGFHYFDATLEMDVIAHDNTWVDSNGRTPGKHSGELADLPNFLSGTAGANDDGYQFTFTDDATYGDKTVWWNTNAGNGGAWVDANGTVVITNP